MSVKIRLLAGLNTNTEKVKSWFIMKYACLLLIMLMTCLYPQLGTYAHPIFSEEGDYPSVVKERVDANSKAEGFTTSRLPKFTSEEVNFIKGNNRFTAKYHI